MLRIISINLNGIRSAADKGFFEWLHQQQPDIVCMQELKAQADNLTPVMQAPQGLQGYFHYAEKKGYSGVGLYTRQQPETIVTGLGIEDIDAEGRYLQLDFPNLSVISLYLPSGSSSDERQQAKYSFMSRFMSRLDTLRTRGKEVVICGDWNIAHQEIDLKNWKGNQKNSGFLPEERAWLSALLEQGWVDVYRHLHPDTTGESYTWWSNRGQAWAKNVGWRLDYQIATPSLASRATKTQIYKNKRFSDHAPLTIDYDWSFS